MLVTQSCPTLCNPMDCMYPARLLCLWDFPGKNIGVGCHFLLQWRGRHPYKWRVPNKGKSPTKGQPLLSFQIFSYVSCFLDFPGSSDGKESACNVGDLGSIPGLGRSPVQGSGFPLQYPGQENSMDRGAWQATVHRVIKSRTQLSNLHSLMFLRNIQLKIQVNK